MLKSISANTKHILIAGWLLLIAFSSKGQSKGETSTYWMNSQYRACIDSGKSTCHCQEQNPYLILQIDSARKLSPSSYTEDMNPMDTVKYKLTIIPSIYRSWETLEAPLSPARKNCFSVTPRYGIDSGMTIKLEETHLYLTYKKQSIKFIEIELIHPGDSSNWEMSSYLGSFNCNLLGYSIKPGKGGKVFLTNDDLVNYISKWEIAMSCSDDFNYNEITVKKNDSTYLYFFLVYKQDTIELYKEPGRNRGEEIDTTKLQESEIFFKKK